MERNMINGVKPALKKTWLSPALAIIFTIVSATGIMLFMDIQSGMILSLHELLGLAFTGAGAVHLALNWKIFKKYFSKKGAALALIVTLMICLITAVTGEDKNKYERKDARNHYAHWRSDR